MSARSRRPASVAVSIASRSRRASAGERTGVAPLVTTCFGPRTAAAGMSRALLKLSGSLVHDYATISDDSPSPNRASRARRAATSAGIS